jgi:hypothetical protein
LAKTQQAPTIIKGTNRVQTRYGMWTWTHLQKHADDGRARVVCMPEWYDNNRRYRLRGTPMQLGLAFEFAEPSANGVVAAIERVLDLQFASNSMMFTHGSTPPFHEGDES